MNYIKIGERTVPMVVNAATDAIYERLFKESSILVQAGNDLKSGPVVALIYRMGFIMAAQAKYSNWRLNRLKASDYSKWLAQFERSDYLDAIWAIRLVYEGWSDERIKEYGEMSGDE